jgi:hypothetical protein
MPLARLSLLALLLSVGTSSWILAAEPIKEYKSGKVWPEPKVVTPGEGTAPPSDAIVLFDGTNLDAWKGGEKWKIADGIATVAGGSIETKQKFGDMQMHIEWASPDLSTYKDPKKLPTGQQRGNSGIYIMGKYEVQILDSFENTTYFDGQAASIYKQHPPLVNASRKPGEWQSYDIIFHAPKFGDDGAVTKPATLTVLHNGVLVQDHFELEGGTSYIEAPKYTKHADKLPISLQNHGNPVRFRNIWVRELAPPVKPILGQPNK